MAEPLVLVNSFEVPGERAEEFIATWEQARDYLRQQPGYIDTALHQAVLPDPEFRFVNIAHWRTAEECATAIQSPAFQQIAARMASYRSHPGLYQVVRA
jgi:heme-degrading monooxygenase HmoA